VNSYSPRETANLAWSLGKLGFSFTYASEELQPLKRLLVTKVCSVCGGAIGFSAFDFDSVFVGLGLMKVRPLVRETARITPPRSFARSLCTH
jgi:hypothetical protein